MHRDQDDEGRPTSEGTTPSSRSGTLAQAFPAQSCLSLSNIIEISPLNDNKLQPRSVIASSTTIVSSLLIHSSVIAVPRYCTPPVNSWGMKTELEKAAISVD